MNELTNIESLCRICLTRSKSMIPLNTGLENTKKDPLLIDALEEIVGTKITCDNRFPKAICPMCLGLLRISYNLKNQFKKSEKALLGHFKNISLLDNNEQHENMSAKPSPVEIIVGSNKYDLKDIFIVEDEKQDQENFKGFLNNLGKTVTVKFVDKSKIPTKNLHEEEPVVLIEKLESETKDSAIEIEEVNSDVECLDQYIITKDNDQLTENFNDSIFKVDVNLENLDLENITDADHELFKSALNMQLKCSICGKLYSSRGRFRKHLESCEKVQCDTVKNDIGAIVAFKCPVCPRIFKQKKFLNYHVKTTHCAEPKKYTCEMCGEISRNRNAFAYHKLTKHGERKFECELCGKKFFTANVLKTHVQNHTQRNVTQCICPVCGKTFHYKSGLFYHMKLHTNERKYCCDFCDRKFYTLNAKKRHTLTHTGIRPYACKYCEKRFFSSGEVRKHEYLHTGVRPYRCQYCKKGFSSSYNMKVHLVSHRGPYECKYCNKTVVSMNVLQFHHKTKHRVSEESENNLEECEPGF